MLRFKSTVPVDFGIIKAKRTIGFTDFDVGVWISCEDFEIESSVLALFAYFVDFVGYSADARIFI